MLSVSTATHLPPPTGSMRSQSRDPACGLCGLGGTVRHSCRIWSRWHARTGLGSSGPQGARSRTRRPPQVHNCRSAPSTGPPASGNLCSLDAFVFPERWADLRGHDLEAEQRRDLLRRELEQEVSKGHQLWQLNVTAVASCGHCDDVIYRLGDDRFAIVHLVWQGRQRAPWPSTDVLGTWAEVVDRVIAHEEL